MGFLLAANGAYSKLKMGAKGKGSAGCQTWMVQTLRVRESDDLLSHIWRARNVAANFILGWGEGLGVRQGGSDTSREARRANLTNVRREEAMGRND